MMEDDYQNALEILAGYVVKEVTKLKGQGISAKEEAMTDAVVSISDDLYNLCEKQLGWNDD